MNNTFQQKYIKTWANIANNNEEILLKGKYAREILKYLSIELGRQKRSIYKVCSNLMP